MSNEKKNYIDADELKQETINSKNSEKPTERFGELMLILHDHILATRKYCNQPKHIKEELKSYSLMRIFKRGIHTVNTDLTSRKLFNYFSTACMINMLHKLQDIIKKEQKERAYINAAYNELQNNPVHKACKP